MDSGTSLPGKSSKLGPVRPPNGIRGDLSGQIR